MVLKVLVDTFIGSRSCYKYFNLSDETFVVVNDVLNIITPEQEANLGVMSRNDYYIDHHKYTKLYPKYVKNAEKNNVDEVDHSSLYRDCSILPYINDAFDGANYQEVYCIKRPIPNDIQFKMLCIPGKINKVVYFQKAYLIENGKTIDSL